MPPKKKDEPVSEVPELEELVELPEEVGSVPEPNFCFVLGHLVGHPLRVEEPPKAPAEGEEAPADPGPLPVHDFDPCALVFARAKETEDPFNKSIVVVDREDLQRTITAEADGEDKSLAWALRNRIEKEKAARKRRKWNDARRKAIVAFEAAKAAEAAGDAAGEDTSKAVEEEKPKSARAENFLLLLRDYGTTQEEIQEIASEGCCADGLVELFCIVNMAGETIEESEGNRLRVMLEPPELVNIYYDIIHAAPINTDLSNSTICTHAQSHSLAFPPGDVSAAEHVISAIMETVGKEAARRQQFGKWLRDAKHELGPASFVEKDAKSESRHYQRMMGSVAPLHHDVPLFLHCLTEQVALTQSGDAQKHEDKTAMCSLEEYLGAACNDFVTEGPGPVPRPSSGMSSSPMFAADDAVADGVDKEADKTPLLPNLDQACCAHSLAGGGNLDGGEPVIDAVHGVLKQLRVAGAQRSGLPKDAIHSAAQREALRCRIYPFAPAVPSAEMEQLLLLHAFEDLLSAGQPERSWSLGDRIFRERISRQFLLQTLTTAFANEPFLRTSYLPRHDCLLVALYHRSLPGSTMWHAWKGDLRTPSTFTRWKDGLFTTPTYNDWAHIISDGSEQKPQACRILQGIDARQLGYLNTVEKLATPADGSVILVSKFEQGIETSFPFPSASFLQAACAEPAGVNDAGSSSGVADAGEAAPSVATTSFEPSVRHTSKLTRVMKEGRAFGIVDDGAWNARVQIEREKRMAEMEAAEAATRAAEAEETTGSRPASPVVNPADIPLSGEQVDLSFPGINFSQFWMAFEDGARCTARMHHETSALNVFADSGRELPQLGVLFTYSLAAGLVVQVFSDGAVRLMFPLAIPSREDGPGADPVRTKDHMQQRLPSGSAPHFKPGCSDDVEIMRTVTPIGTVIRKLLSGRVEVYYTDGSTAMRNPTEGELHSQLAELQQKIAESGNARVELLERLCKVYAAQKDLSPLKVVPDAKQKAEGLPGHWLVTRPDGSVFGRASASLRNPTPAPKTPSPVPDADADAGGDSGEVASAAGETKPKTPLPKLDELLGGVWVDGGAYVEYEIDPGASVATHVDLQTQHKTRTNSQGVAMYEDPDGLRQVCIHSEGTRVVRLKKEGGYEIVVSKEPMALVRCEFTEQWDDRSSSSIMVLRIFVECVDGTRLEVIPQTLSRTGLMKVDPRAADFDQLSTHAFVILKRDKGPVIISRGLGQVDIHYSAEQPGADPEFPVPVENMPPAYLAHCGEGRLFTQDPDGILFEIRGDQTLEVTGGDIPVSGNVARGMDMVAPGGSPRCSMPDTAYMALGMEDMPLTSNVPPPRLFVIYGEGDAEELLTESDAAEVLRAARAEPDTVVVEGELMNAPLEVCRCHTIFQTKTLHGYQVANTIQGSVLSSVGSLDTGWSLGSTPAAPPPPAPPAITKFRQFIEYPIITEDKQMQFHGTLKQYRAWEQEEIRKSRAVMQIEVKSSGKDKKGDKSKKKGDKDKDKTKKEADKGGKKKRGSAIEMVVADDAEPAPEPAFAMDLKLNAFDHVVQVLALRAQAKPEPTDASLLNQAVEAREARQVAEAQQKEHEMSAVDGPDMTLEGAVRDLPSDGAGFDIVDADATLPLDETAAPETEIEAEPEGPPKRPADTPILRLLRPKLADAPTFAYFKSEEGLQFLMDTGEMDPERKPRQRGERPNQRQPPPMQQQRSPWNPRLLGEMNEEQEMHAQMDAAVDERSPVADLEQQARGPRWVDVEATNVPRGFPGESPDGDDPQLQAMGTQGGAEGMPFNPNTRLPIVAEASETPHGPHPDKKNNLWDIYGQPRAARPTASHAYVTLNTDYLEVEGATDRRVRTSSIAHKKNSGKAPSVQSVRKTGTHALGKGSEVAAGEILGELGVANPEEHWKLTSTMQGLGDSNNLVEVTPGTCRFGPLRQGSVYRMAFYIRNLDVDVTRFNVVPLESEFVSVRHQPGQLAPGMAAKITVEVAAKQPARVEQLVEVKVKAHVVRVPVTAKILEVEEYDRLDAQSFALHGRRIGRHREKAANGGKRVVEVVTDEAHNRKVMGKLYMPPPPDFEDTIGTSGNATGMIS